MAFRIWFYFLVFTTLLLSILWLLQITFVESYYERNRVQTIDNQISEIEVLLSKGSIDTTRDAANKLLSYDNLCGAIYNGFGTNLANLNDVKSNCFLKELPQATINEYMIMAYESPSGVMSIPFVDDTNLQETHLVGKYSKINDNVYYIFVSGSVQLADVTVHVLKKQFTLIALSIFSIATMVTLILARKLSFPIVRITESANRLAMGDLTVNFEGEDYTEIKALSKTLNYATQEFKKTDELRRDLVANVSHDIKTPLTMIRAYAEMVQDLSGDDPEMRAKHLGVILDETEHLENLVTDMLTLSKYEANAFEIRLSAFNLQKHIEKTVSLFSGMDVDFVVNVKPKVKVVADEVKMGQVLYNFVNNATKYVGDDNIIEINTKEVGEEIIVSVTDHGIGIADEILEHIWDRYYKIDKNHKRTVKSSGLGLSIVKAICDATGSKCWVESSVGEGSTFFYTLKLETPSITHQPYERDGFF